MSKAARTREYIIEKAAPVFNKKGYAGTSLTDLLEATGLTKGALYGNFENKDAIAVAVYEHNTRALSKRLDGYIETEPAATARLLAFMDYYRTNWKKTFERGGCPILNASIEADDNLPFLQKTVRTSIRRFIARLSRIITEGQQAGEFKKGIDAEAYAYTFMMILEGGIMLSKIGNTPKHLFAGLDRMEKILNEELKK